MKYKLKKDGLFIIKKETHLKPNGDINNIDWLASLGVDEANAVEFTEIEKDFMVEKYFNGLEVINV